MPSKLHEVCILLHMEEYLFIKQSRSTVEKFAHSKHQGLDVLCIPRVRSTMVKV